MMPPLINIHMSSHAQTICPNVMQPHSHIKHLILTSQQANFSGTTTCTKMYRNGCKQPSIHPPETAVAERPPQHHFPNPVPLLLWEGGWASIDSIPLRLVCSLHQCCCQMCAHRFWIWLCNRRPVLSTGVFASQLDMSLFCS